MKEFDHSARATLDIKRLAHEVFARLQRDDIGHAIDDPLRYVFGLAETVANEWRMQADVLRDGENPLDHLTAGFRGKSVDDTSLAVVQSRVQRAVQELPQRERQILLLHVNERLTYSEIASQLGLPAETVLEDLASAYSRLRLQSD